MGLLNRLTRGINGLTPRSAVKTSPIAETIAEVEAEHASHEGAASLDQPWLSMDENDSSNLDNLTQDNLTQDNLNNLESASESADCTFMVIAGNLYRLSLFSEGGVSQVFKALPICRQLPALTVKMIKQDWLSHSAVRRQFNLEAHIMRGLHHPNLPRFVSRGNFRGRAFLAYEFLPGQPLIRMAQEKTLYGDEQRRSHCVAVVRQLLEQLHYLHTKINPIVHGDISAENVIIDESEQATLADFGCAHFLNIPGMNSYRWLAKPSYLSPEQARGDSWGAPSDIYQTGILLYELITGVRWIKGSTPREKMLYAASIEDPGPRFLSHTVSADLSSTLASMLVSDPKKRAYKPKELSEQLALAL